MCTFEKDDSCLLTNDNTGNEIWDIVDGRGIVADNTLRKGLSLPDSIYLARLWLRTICTLYWLRF